MCYGYRYTEYMMARSMTINETNSYTDWSYIVLTKTRKPNLNTVTTPFTNQARVLQQKIVTTTAKEVASQT
jgi:hypothetical protein